MDYEKKYKEALERAKELSKTTTGANYEYIFPELKESEDEKIREELICFLNTEITQCKARDKYIAWLKKQGKQKPIFDFKAEDWYVSKVDGKIHNIYYNTNKVEPKFKAGDWVTVNDSENGLISLLNIVDSDEIQYRVEDIEGCSGDPRLEYLENNYHLWSIQDAKDGDILSYVTDEGDLWIMIYQSLYKPYEGHVHYHKLLVDDILTDEGTCCISIDNLKPATIEQRDILFQKMKNADYEQNSDKKEPIKL